MRTQAENKISPEDNQKTLQCFSFQNGGYRTPKSLARKVRENSSFIQKPDIRFHHLLTALVGVKIVRQLY